MPRRRHVCLIACMLSAALAPITRGESLRVTSSPPGATVEIDGVLVGTTPYRSDYPGGYFHKPHTVFAARLDHSMTLRISKDGYSAQQVTLTDGPFEWIAVTGKHHGNYFLLKSDHFELKLQPADKTAATGTGYDRVGPIHPSLASAPNIESVKSERGVGSVAIASDPLGAEIYVDGNFVGQTPSTIPMSEGAHRVVVKFQGKRDWERNLEVIRGGQLTLHPVLSAAP
jgi:PEGA domain